MPPERVQLSPAKLVATIGGAWPDLEVAAAAELLRAGNGKFPMGLRTLPADLIDAVQRERLLAAMHRASAQLGYRDLTVQDVLDRSGVSRPTFYEQFENKEECFLAAFDAAATRLAGRLRGAAREGGGRWRDRLRSGLEELLSFVVADPDAAWTLIVEARAACPAALVRRDELLDGFVACLDSEIRADSLDPTLVSPIAAAGMVGGIETLLYNRLTSGDTRDLESLLPSLMYFAVLPFEGHEAASTELAAVSLK